MRSVKFVEETKYVYKKIYNEIPIINISLNLLTGVNHYSNSQYF